MKSVSCNCIVDGEQKLAGASLLIFANKQDLAGALSVEDIATVLELDQISSSRHWHIQVSQARSDEFQVFLRRMRTSPIYIDLICFNICRFSYR
jgi:signal recognition particle receptor subunit beta